MGDGTVIAVLGLGEAGSAIAADLATRGVAVRGWDPVVQDVPGVTVSASAQEAVTGADVICSVNSATVALAVARDVAPHLSQHQLFADFNTGSPVLKENVHEVISGVGARFVDVALMAPVPGKGVQTPVLVSGPGAPRFAELMGPLGMPVEVVDERPGSAAARKLLRSIFMKGFAAAILEGLAAAEKFGWADWYKDDVGKTLSEADASLVERFIRGSRQHAGRRVTEMTAAAELLLSVGVIPRVALASAEILQDLQRESPPSTDDD